MTLFEFRSNPMKISAFAEILRGDGTSPTILAEAIVAVQNERVLRDAKHEDMLEVSARLLSQAVGRIDAITDLLSCAEPLPPPVVEEPATFGVNPADFQPK